MRIRLTGCNLKVMVGLSTKSGKEVGRGTNICPFAEAYVLEVRYVNRPYLVL